MINSSNLNLYLKPLIKINSKYTAEVKVRKIGDCRSSRIKRRKKPPLLYRSLLVWCGPSYLFLLIITETQIKTMTRYQLRSLRISVTKKTKLVLEKMWRKGNPCELLVGVSSVQPLWKTAWRILKKWKMELLYDPAILLLEYIPKETKLVSWKDIWNPMFMQHFSK